MKPGDRITVEIEVTDFDDDLDMYHAQPVSGGWFITEDNRLGLFADKVPAEDSYMPINSKLHALQDQVLLSLTGVPAVGTGVPSGELDREALRQLPPWRAIMLARIAYKARMLKRDELDRMLAEVRRTGGNGTLRTWAVEKKLLSKVRS